MAHPNPYRPARYLQPSSQGDPRRVARYLIGLIATIAATAALGAIAIFQVTSEEPAKDALRRATAALTEIDALLVRHEEALRDDARTADTGGTLELQDYPVSLALTPAEVSESSPEQLRTLILDRSADRLYEDGTGVLRESAEARGNIGTFSVPGITDRALGTLTSENHAMFGILAVVLTVGAVALIVATAATCTGWGKLTAAGVVLMLAGGLTLLMGWFSMWSAGSSAGDEDDFVRAELFRVLEDLMLAPTRAGAAVLAVGIVFVAAAFVASFATGADGRRHAAETG